MKKYIFPFLLILLIFITSCFETSGRGNLKITLETTPEAKSLQPDEKASRVVKYNIQGIGPGGKAFSQDSTTRTVTVSGIPMGTWTISATGYNSTSNAVVSGCRTFEFKNSTDSVSIAMSPASGSGALQVDYKWDKGIANANLEIIIEGSGLKEKDTYNSTDGSNSYKYTKAGLNAGTYKLITNLYNGSSLVVGTVESVQIINNRTTSGTISLSSPTGKTQEGEKIDIKSETGAVISGHFSIEGNTKLPTTLEANTEQTINFNLDSSLTANSNFYITWFLDGSEITAPTALSKTNSMTFTPYIGNHIINVVISSDKDENCGSVSFAFSGKTSAKKGAATYAGTVKLSNHDDVILASDTIIGALPDDHFIAITPSRSSMQILTVYNNSLIVSKSQTYNATDYRFTWLSQAQKIYSDPRMNFFAVQTSEDNIYILQYFDSSEKTDVVLWEDEPLSFSGFVENPPCFIDEITTVALVPSQEKGGSLFIFDSGPRSEELLAVVTSESEVKSMGTSTRAKGMKYHICSDGFGNQLAVLTDDGTLYFANTSDGVTTSSWGSYTDLKLSDTSLIKFLNSRLLLSQNPSSLVIYEFYPKQKYWVARYTLDISLNDCGKSEDGAFIYMADKEGNLITYKSSLTDNFGKLFSVKTINPIQKLSINTHHILGSDSFGNLYIFNISQEDSSI